MIHIKGIRFDMPLVRRMGVLKHLGTYPVTWDRHDGMEIHYVMKGEIAWELQDSPNPMSIPGGSFGIIPAGVRHRAFNNKGTPAVRFGAIFESPKPEYAVGTGFLPEDLKRVFERLETNGCCVRRFSSRIASTIRDLADAMTLDALGTLDGRLRLRALSFALLYETYVALGTGEPIVAGHDVMPTIRRWIDEHCAEEITIDRLLKLSGYGRSRFFELFFADTGMTPNDFIIRSRIRLAKRRLTGSFSSSMLDLAISCGFPSASVFSSTFRKHVGMTPREFVKRHRDTVAEI